MLRTALLFFCLLGFAASAAPSAARHTSNALRNQRLTRGNHVPVYKTYPNHSRQDKSLFSFLHFGGRQSAAARRHSGRPASHASRRYTTGIF